jgi:TPR repeat protein
MNRLATPHLSAITRTLLVATALLLTLPHSARADYDEGVKAYMKGSYKKALRAFMESAEGGDARAQFYIGSMYDSGQGVSKDSKKAIQWYRRAAKKGNPNAQYNLGVLYYTGEGVKKSHRKAVDWWEKAARQKLDSAQLNLAIAHFKGEGVDQDYVKAYMWATIASNFGNQQSRMFMNDLVLLMSLEQLNSAERDANRWMDTHN